MGSAYLAQDKSLDRPLTMKNTAVAVLRRRGLESGRARADATGLHCRLPQLRGARELIAQMKNAARTP